MLALMLINSTQLHTSDQQGCYKCMLHIVHLSKIQSAMDPKLCSIVVIVFFLILLPISSFLYPHNQKLKFSHCIFYGTFPHVNDSKAL